MHRYERLQELYNPACRGTTEDYAEEVLGILNAKKHRGVGPWRYIEEHKLTMQGSGERKSMMIFVRPRADYHVHIGETGHYLLLYKPVAMATYKTKQCSVQDIDG